MGDDYRALHRVIRKIANLAVVSFFTQVHVIGSENVPVDGPLIVCATHHNMMLDPAVLSTTFPYGRILNYWSKASLFANPVLKYILSSTGNIPVERKSKDRRVLFAGTIDALAKGWSVALFPEGTSYTEPRIMQVKDGAAWAAMEYTKWAQENPGKADQKPLVIVPAAIVYTNKSKYRSDVIVEYGKPITLDEYLPQFFEDTEGSGRAAVKRLTATIHERLVQTTINAPDWDTLFAARMARDLLWESESISLDDFVTVSQTLVDLFSTPELVPNFTSVRRQLLTYYSLLQSTGLTNDVLSGLPLDAALDPNKHTPLALRLRTLALLVKDTLASLVRLPFFAFPLIVHAPVYIMSRLGDRLAKDEEETQAQNKVVLGLLSMFMIYPIAFFFLWALLWFSPVGALLAGSTLYLFANYHNRLINANYLHAKRLLAAWRILLGVWTPKRFDVPLAALAQYTTPFIPPESPWIDRKEPTASGTASPAPGKSMSPALDGAAVTKQVDAKAARRKRKAPTRKLIRHVLRARADAVRALGSLIGRLESDGLRWVNASPHLAIAYNGRVEKEATESDVAVPVERGYRTAHEVLRFLRNKGARFAMVERTIEGDWAMLSSGEQTPGLDSEREELTWVPPSQS